MISKVTKSNKALYEARLQQINEALIAAGSSARVTDFESYFGNIREIEKLATNFVGKASGDSESGTPGKFFLMPLDEPLFEIDANKRTISIPSDFSKNGIGVRGDHMAETLYFKIDRYFDHQDLFQVDEIIINWQFRPANASRNAEIPMHTSLAFAPDDEYIPGYVVFGWVIDQNMTPSKGTLSFSIGFVKKEDSRYQYALNTTIASVNVNDSLFLEDPSILATLKRPVFERLTDSRYSESGIEPVDDPVWRSGAEDVDEFGNKIRKGLYAIANFNLKDDGTEDEELALNAIGYVANQDGVNIKYDWSGSSFASGELVEGRDRDSASVEADWIKTEDLAPKDGVSYYVKEGNNFVRLTDVSDPTLEEAFADDVLPKYELGNSFVVTEGGAYQVSMQAFRTTSQSGGDAIVSKSRAINSINCIVPHAAIPAVTLKVAGIAPKAETAYTPNTEEYFIADEEKANGFTFVGDNAPSVKALITKDEKNVLSRSGLDALSAVASKLSIAPADINAELSQQNQDSIDVITVENEVFVIGKLDALNSFASTNPAQGEAKWVGLDIATNVDDITKLTWNGYQLTADDVAEAASVNLEAGHIIFWAKAEALPKVIRIARENYGEVELKVSFVDKDSFVVPEASIADEAKAFDNARKGIIKESSLGRIALTFVEEDEEPDFSNAEWVRYDSASEFEVPNNNGSIEGTYCVYAMNERNHTQSLSEPSEVINVSKIAPAIRGITVYIRKNSTSNIMMVENNSTVIKDDEPQKYTVSGLDDVPTNGFIQISDNFNDFASIPELEVKIEEIDAAIWMNEQRIVFVDEPDSANEYNVENPDQNNRRSFSISGLDQGTFIVKVTTKYNGTSRITYTEPFYLTRL